MNNRFFAMNYEYQTGVIDRETGQWAIEPQFPWNKAAKLADALNDNPELDPDYYLEVMEAK